MSFNGVVPAESCLSKIPPLQNPVFIADLHLAADKPATKEAFFKFLKNDAARFSELVILGDLFEFWPETIMLRPMPTFWKPSKLSSSTGTASM